MGFDTDSKGARTGRLPFDNKALQPAISNRSKSATAAGEAHNQGAMATIADDDDRLLVRIGYTPVSVPCW
jgi:hypothetical protein